MEEQLLVLCLISAAFCPGGSGSVSEERVRPGDNVTIHCDCACPTGFYTLWYHISQHNRPMQMWKFRWNTPWAVAVDGDAAHSQPARVQIKKDDKPNCNKLLITNITESEEGIYFCGTETVEVVEDTKISSKPVIAFGNASTRVFLAPSESGEAPSAVGCGVCWTLLWSLCPALTLLLALLLVLLLYFVCRRKGTKRADSTVQPNQTEESADDGVCYAALEIRQASQRPKRKKETLNSSDFSTYSAVKTSQ